MDNDTQRTLGRLLEGVDDLKRRLMGIELWMEVHQREHHHGAGNGRREQVSNLVQKFGWPTVLAALVADILSRWLGA